jgi:FKBP-type peptidyl-prolyl cis-trans isomerase FkpA
MNFKTFLIVCSSVLILAACGKQAEEEVAAAEPEAVREELAAPEAAEEATLQIEIIKEGEGRAAVAGDNVSVHYTGWLFDETAEDNRGAKFDSSVDRGEQFAFPLGAGRVIKGWDEGVAGMLIGEKRVLTIPPDMGYGDRGAGAVIPPGATLIFEVELFDAQTMGQ